MTRPAALAAITAALACAASPAAAAEVALRHDPFAVPPVREPAPAPSVTEEPQAAPVVAVWRAQLRAVLVDGERSLANVDGVVVRMGGEVDGFRLVEVAEGRAVFVRDGRRFELTMDAGGRR